MLRLLALLGLAEFFRDERGKAVARTAGILLALLAAFLVFTWFAGNLAQIGSHSETLALIYTAGFIVICGLTYLVVRPGLGPRRVVRMPPPDVDSRQIRAQVRKKSEQIGRKLETELVQPVISGLVCILGLPDVGKRSLRSLLERLLPMVRAEVYGDTSVDRQINAGLAASIPAGATVVYLVTQDLYSYEQELLQELSARGDVRLLVVLNKIDLLSRSAQTEILASLERKAEQLSGPVDLLACATSPRPRLILRQTRDGEEIEEEAPSPPQVQAVLEKFGQGARA
jgi:hypothetical protein